MPHTPRPGRGKRRWRMGALVLRSFCNDSATPALFLAPTSDGTRLALVSDVSLLRRYKVELPGPLLIKERAFGLVAAAPVFVATWDEEVFARPDTFFTGFIFI